MLGEVYEITPEPLANTEPPLEAAYQSIVSPAPGVAEIDTVPVPQRDDDPAVGAEGIGFTVVVMLFEDAGEPVKHGVAFEVITTYTTSPFTNPVSVYVAEFVPTFTSFFFH